jgi:hypothetical protein
MFDAKRLSEMVDDVSQTSIRRLRIPQPNKLGHLLQRKPFLVTHPDQQPIGLTE